MYLNKVKTLAAVVAALGAMMAAPAHAGKTVDAIKARGQVICGVNPQTISRFRGVNNHSPAL